MKNYKIHLFSMALLLMGCQADESQPVQQNAGTLSFTTSVEQFEGETTTRTILKGNAFETGDKIKLKIVCPFSTNTEYGESTYSASFDGFWLLRWNSKWEILTSTETEKYDIDGDYKPSNAPNLFERYLTQPTPYVFTAQTWTEEQIFMAGTKHATRVEQYSNVFHANQSKEADYKACDLMWAQTIQQTGAYNVHLNFKHVMAALMINVEGIATTDNAVLTLKGMPDIDQAEVIVGDYYAGASKVNVANETYDYDYSYRIKSSCSVADNGKVLGIAVINDEKQKASCKGFDAIGNNATYTAYRVPSTNTFRLIVPPCDLGTKSATIWLRTGNKLENRYSLSLSQTKFEAGNLYTLKMTIN